MNFGKTFLACLLAIVVGSIVSFFFTLLVVAGIISSISFFAEESYSVSPRSVLMIDLSEPIVEHSSSNLLDNFDLQKFTIKKTVSIYDAVALIDAAASDARIKGIYIKVTPQVAASSSALYELREALVRFRSNSLEKFVITYGDTYSQGALYLSSVADKIYVNPMGGVEWSGMAATATFFKGTLDKLGVEPEIIRHGKFKSAVEPFMLTKLSDENRLQLESMVGSMWGYFVGEIASARSLSADTLQMLASELRISTAQDAMRAGLVDSVIYRDRLIENLKVLCDGVEPDLVTLNEYRRSGVNINGDVMSHDEVAVIYATGDIVDVGDANTQIVGNDLAATIRSVRQDDAVKAIVLRVNSPGGSALASEVVRHEVEMARAAKPLVVSMGDYAASGGYWISVPADEIVATPTTLTGSIGVFGLMFNVEKGAREKLGVTFDVVKTNPSADMGSITRPLTALERRTIQNSVDTIYNRFVINVVRGRQMSAESVDSLGGGRVWSGLQAKENGLVNSIGGLSDAIILAGEKAGVEKYRVVSVTSGEQDNFSQIFGALSRGVYSWAFGGVSEKVADAASQVELLVRDNGIKAAMEYNVKVEL